MEPRTPTHLRDIMRASMETHVNPHTLKNWVKRRLLPHWRIGPGGKIYVDPADVKKLTTPQRVEATTLRQRREP